MKYYSRIQTRSGSINTQTWPTRMLTPSKQRTRSRANSIGSIGFLWGPARPARSPESQSGFVQKFPEIKVVAVEPVGSVTFGGAPAKRNIPGIGTSVRPKLADLAKPDRIVEVSEAKTVEACLSFVRDYHLLVGGSTGTVLAAVQQLAPEFRSGDTIVAISPDLGEKYLDTVYDPIWVDQVIRSEDTEDPEGVGLEQAYALVAAG